MTRHISSVVPLQLSKRLSHCRYRPGPHSADSRSHPVSPSIDALALCPHVQKPPADRQSTGICHADTRHRGLLVPRSSKLCLKARMLLWRAGHNVQMTCNLVCIQSFVSGSVKCERSSPPWHGCVPVRLYLANVENQLSRVLFGRFRLLPLHRRSFGNRYRRPIHQVPQCRLEVHGRDVLAVSFNHAHTSGSSPSSCTS